MKKILIAVLIVLLSVMAYFAIFKGLEILEINIMSVSQIIDENNKLTNQITEVNSLQKKELTYKQEELSESVTELLKQKELYFNIAKSSTEGEITKANTEETYYIEYLWTRIGRHATSKGVNLKMDVNSSDVGDSSIKNLAFSATGRYTSIIDFIYELEDDSKLNFKIENFKMLASGEEPEEPEYGSKSLTAMFNVNNIRIKLENVTANVVAEKIEKTEEQNNTTNTVENQVNAAGTTANAILENNTEQVNQ